MFVIVIVSLLRKNFQPEIKSKKSTNIKFVREQLIIVTTLSILFGLGWGIGLLATQDIHTNKTVRDLFAALFVIITAFHGLFIFIMHCLRSKEARSVWKRWFFNVSGKDFNEFTASVLATKRNKTFIKVTNPLYANISSIKKEKETINETALDSMNTESKVECVMSAETSFVEDENEKKMLEVEEKH